MVLRHAASVLLNAPSELRSRGREGGGRQKRLRRSYDETVDTIEAPHPQELGGNSPSKPVLTVILAEVDIVFVAGSDDND